MSASDPSSLLHTLIGLLEEEARLLEANDVVALQSVVDRKDQISHDLSLHPALAVPIEVVASKQPEWVPLLERCQALNGENGQRIEHRRRWVQERLARIAEHSTYTAQGSIQNRGHSHWQAQA